MNLIEKTQVKTPDVLTKEEVARVQQEELAKAITVTILHERQDEVVKFIHSIVRSTVQQLWEHGELIASSDDSINCHRLTLKENSYE